MPSVSMLEREDILNYLDALVEYLPEEEQEKVFALMEGLEGQTEVTPEQAELLHHYAVLAWPARRAVERYTEAEAGEAEWEEVLKHVRPTTALLLKRLRERGGYLSVLQALQASEAGHALHREERFEIELVRKELLVERWKAKANALEGHLVEAKKELEAMHHRIQKLEQFAQRSDRKAELEQKAGEFRKRIYLQGETIPIDQLDETLRVTIQELLAKEQE